MISIYSHYFYLFKATFLKRTVIKCEFNPTLV